MSKRSSMLVKLLAALAVVPLASCLWSSGLAWPGPMDLPDGELPPGDSAQHPAGPEEASVLRHSDPVRVRPAGALTGYPLAFYRKRARLTAGGSVVVNTGGRAEILWPSGSSVVIFGRCVAWIGSPSRGEPILSFQELSGAKLLLVPGDRVELLGGGVLAGDSGPYMIDRAGPEVLRVRNQSDGSVLIAFRDDNFDLDPGQDILLPLLSAGGAPQSVELAFERVVGPGFVVLTRGSMLVADDPDSVSAVGVPDPPGERTLVGLGVVVRLDSRSGVVFSGLGVKPAAPTPATPLEARAPDLGAPATQPPAGEQP